MKIEQTVHEWTTNANPPFVYSCSYSRMVIARLPASTLPMARYQV